MSSGWLRVRRPHTPPSRITPLTRAETHTPLKENLLSNAPLVVWPANRRRGSPVTDNLGSAPHPIKILENPGKSWKILENPGKSWKILENPGKSWKILENPGNPSSQTFFVSRLNVKEVPLTHNPR